MDIAKKLQGWLPVVAILAYAGLTKGLTGILNILLISVVVVPIAWVLMRLIAGTWNIKELSKNSIKVGSPEYEKRQASFWKYAAKLFLIAVVVVVCFLGIFVMVMKKYFLN